jgi:AmmeMemoRadiSam system protein B
MRMHEGNFSLIFYPQTLEGPRPDDGKPALPQALLLPHAAYQWVGKELEEAYHRVGGSNPDRVVILAPLHQDRRPSMRDHWLFVPADDSIRMGNGTAFYDTSLIQSVIARFPQIVQADDSVFLEEPGWELHAALSASHFPFIPLVPLLCEGSLDSARVRILTTILGNLVGPQTLLIVTSNASSLLAAKPAWEQASAFATALIQGEPLLDKGHKGIIGACGYALVEAVGRLPWFTGRWTITGASVNDARFSAVPPSVVPCEGDGVWHLCAEAQRMQT